jgi:hypothetical protein
VPDILDWKRAGHSVSKKKVEELLREKSQEYEDSEGEFRAVTIKDLKIEYSVAVNA